MREVKGCVGGAGEVDEEEAVRMCGSEEMRK